MAVFRTSHICFLEHYGPFYRNWHSILCLPDLQSYTWHSLLQYLARRQLLHIFILDTFKPCPPNRGLLRNACRSRSSGESSEESAVLGVVVFLAGISSNKDSMEKTGLPWQGWCLSKKPLAASPRRLLLPVSFALAGSNTLSLSALRWRSSIFGLPAPNSISLAF